MKRRDFIRYATVVASAGVSLSVSGCLNDKQAPPRRSEVLDSANLSDGVLVLNLEDSMSVKTRKDFSSSQSASSFSPVGVASAKGRGATGRATGGYSSAPKTSNGWAIWGAGGYVAGWYSNNEDDVTEVSVSPEIVGISYFGSEDEFKEQAPGPGSVNWDYVTDSVSEGEELRLDEVSQEGWYRVGCNVVVDEPGMESRDMGFDSLDFRVERDNGDLKIAESWIVKPRI